MLDVAGLEEEVSVEFFKSGPVHISTSVASDIPTAMGFAHAVNHTWEVILMRQAALGRLAEWFGSSALPEDRLSRRLRLGADARMIYDRLPRSERELLVRYSEGMNAGLDLEEIQAAAALVLMEISPEKWEPWHALAVERLWMWLASDSQPEDVLPGKKPRSGERAKAEGLWTSSDFGAADRALRRRLHLFGFRNNLAAGVLDGDQFSLLGRYVTGDSGLPIFQSIAISVGEELYLEGLSVPGTLFFPAGRNGSGSWAALIQTEISFHIAPYPSEINISYERIQDDRRQEEILESVRTSAGELVVELASDTTFSSATAAQANRNVLIVSWIGFSQTSDVAQWINVINGKIPLYAVLSGDGLVVKSDSLRATITGHPETRIETDNLQLITNSIHGDDLIARVSSSTNPVTSRNTPIEFLKDRYSAVAAESIRPILNRISSRSLDDSLQTDSFPVDSLQVDSFQIDSATQEALAYLYAWDYSFDPSSIAASISEALLSFFDHHPVDTLSAREVYARLRSVLDTLSLRYGSDMRNWRWETVQNRRVYFPGDGIQGDRPSRHVRQFLEEFASVAVTGAGHPSTLGWGPSSRFSWRKASTAWNIAFQTDLNGSFEYTREAVSYTSFLGRFMAENQSVRSMYLHSPDRESYISLLRPVND